jgi:hypothetical protein
MKRFSFGVNAKALTMVMPALGLAFVACANSGGTATGGGGERPGLTWTEVRPFGVLNNPDDNNIF